MLLVGVAVTVNVDLPVPLAGTFTLVGLSEVVSFDPEKNTDKDTVPEKPLTLRMLTVELRLVPCSSDIDVGFTVRTKEGPALLLFAKELSIVPPATVPTAAVRTIRSPFRWTRLLNSILLQTPNPKANYAHRRLTGRVTSDSYQPVECGDKAHHSIAQDPERDCRN